MCCDTVHDGWLVSGCFGCRGFKAPAITWALTCLRQHPVWQRHVVISLFFISPLFLILYLINLALSHLGSHLECSSMTQAVLWRWKYSSQATCLGFLGLAMRPMVVSKIQNKVLIMKSFFIYAPPAWCCAVTTAGWSWGPWFGQEVGKLTDHLWPTHHRNYHNTLTIMTNILSMMVKLEGCIMSLVNVVYMYVLNTWWSCALYGNITLDNSFYAFGLLW